MFAGQGNQGVGWCDYGKYFASTIDSSSRTHSCASTTNYVRNPIPEAG